MEKLSVYESIMERIRRDIALGLIAKDERLPSCRELALEMGVNPNTVQRAYSTLEEQGVLYTIPKKGVYVQGGGGADKRKEMREYFSSLKQAGVKREEMQKMIEEIWEGKQ